MRLYVQPYKIALTNHTYYLFGVDNDKLKTYDVRLISNIEKLGSFKPSKAIVKSIESRLSKYGIKDDGEAVLRVKCKNEEALLKFDKYYEGKGVKDYKNMFYTVVGNSENELYYPLFRMSTKDYKFLDESFENNYIKYLEHHIRSIKNGIN